MSPRAGEAAAAEAVAAFAAYEHRACEELARSASAIAPAVHSLLPEIADRFAAQLAAARANGAFLTQMLEELDLVQATEDSGADESALLHAVSALRSQATEPLTAKAVHEALVSDPRWAALPLSAVKRACSKAAKAARTCGGGPSADAEAPEDTQAAQSSVLGALLQLRREWSEDGAAERQQSYGPILDALARLVPVDRAPAGGPESAARVLVPGAGLGRLVYEAATRGYHALGVEPSFFMLLPAHYVLHSLVPAGRSATIHPMVHELTNCRRAADSCRAVELPGAGPSPAPPPPVRLVSSAFEVLAAEPRHASAWDAVLTAFVVDACPDVTEACEQARPCSRRVLGPPARSLIPGSSPRAAPLTHGDIDALHAQVHQTLRTGGVWINQGPLLYHGQRGGPKLTADELLLLLERRNFKVEEHQFRPCVYCQDESSMRRTEYDCLFFVARKV